jgi:hypothetical protein
VAGRLPEAPDGSTIAKYRTTPLPTLRSAIIPHRARLAQLRALFREPAGTLPVAEFHLAIERLKAFRTAARMWAGESRLAGAGGDHLEAMDRSLDAVELGAWVGRSGPVLQYLIGSACQSIGLRQAEKNSRSLAPAELESALSRLERIDAQGTRLADVLRFERRYNLYILRESLITGRDPADVGPAPDDEDRRAGLMLYPAGWEYREADRFHRDLIAEAERPYLQRRPVREPASPAAKIIAPVVADIEQVYVRNEAVFNLVRLQMALEIARGRKGEYPDALGELQTLQALPDDPFSGRPFLYRRRAKDYLLYSVGPDRKDDGGKPLSVTTSFSDKVPVGDYVAGRLYAVARASSKTGPETPSRH